jgi:hypothetical protein
MRRIPRSDDILLLSLQALGLERLVEPKLTLAENRADASHVTPALADHATVHFLFALTAKTLMEDLFAEPNELLLEIVVLATTDVTGPHQ